MTAFTQFEDIPLFKYDFIMADPDWLFKNWSKKGELKNATAHYDCSPLEEIKAMRVGELAQPNCLLWLWATNPMLPQALECMDAWGFTFKTAGTWAKMSSTWVKGQKDQKQAFGPGYILRTACEPFLIGTIGKPQNTPVVRTCIMAAVREHSRKPDEAFTEAERLMPFATRLELFSRQERSGWDVFGDEISKFNLQGEISK